MVDLAPDTYWKQFNGRTELDLQKGLERQRAVVYDGIKDDAMLALFHEATQELCSVIQPKRRSGDVRHTWEEEEEEEENPRIMRYRLETSAGEEEERKGVLHVVQGWIQQAQKGKASTIDHACP